MSSKNIAAAIPRAKGQLELIERPVPKPGADEVVVRNRAVAINPVDWKIQSFDFLINQFPNVQGSDSAGEVVAVGSDVKNFKVGDRVAGFAPSLGDNNPDHGAFQNYTAIPTVLVTKIPNHLTDEQAATLPMQVATAGSLLFAVLKLPRISGKRVTDSQEGFLVWGGSSSVGAGTVQLAKALGFTTYVAASPQNHSWLKTIGADHLFDYADGEAVVGRIVDAAKAAGETIRYGADAVGDGKPHSSSLAAQVLSKIVGGDGKAQLASVEWTWPEGVDKPDNVEVGSAAAFYMGTKESETGSWLFNEWLAGALEHGQFMCAPPVQRVGEGLKDVQAAYDLLRKGVSGKKLVVPVETAA